tara:strand:- start:27321 stop:27740 length:420 start_codon:yes stop_codon:yes gene_type:complete
MAQKQVTGKDISVSQSFKDVAPGLDINPFTKDASIVKNDNAIKQALKNLVKTIPGEVPFAPNVGTRVSELLFEQMDGMIADSIEDEIMLVVGQYEPRASIDFVRVQPNYRDNAYYITIQYTIVGLPLRESVNFVLQRPE